MRPRDVARIFNNKDFGNGRKEALKAVRLPSGELCYPKSDRIWRLLKATESQ